MPVMPTRTLQILSQPGQLWKNVALQAKQLLPFWSEQLGLLTRDPQDRSLDPHLRSQASIPSPPAVCNFPQGAHGLKRQYIYLEVGGVGRRQGEKGCRRFSIYAAMGKPSTMLGQDFLVM